MNKRISIVISIALVLITVLGMVFLGKPSKENTMLGDKGVLTSNSLNYEKGLIKLAGEWEFYPDKLIYPKENEDVFQKYANEVKLVYVSEDGASYENNNIPKKNIGTYRLKITLPYDGRFGIKTAAMGYSFTAFINGLVVCQNERTIEDTANYFPDNFNKIGIGNSKDRIVDLVIQVIDYESVIGDSLQPVYFGKEDQLNLDKDRNNTLDTLLVAGYLILGIYFMGCYFQRKKALYLLYFSLFTIFLGTYTSTVNNKIIELVISMPKNMDNFNNYQVLFMYLSIFFFLMFINDFFRAYVSKKIVIFLGTLLLIVGPILLFIPYKSIYQLGLPISTHQFIIFAILGVNYLYILASMIKAVYKGAESSGYILVIVVSLCWYIFIMSMEFLFKLNIGRLPVLLFFIVLIAISFMMTERFQSALEKTNHLTDQLLDYEKGKDEYINKIYKKFSGPLHEILEISESMMHDEASDEQLKHNSELIHREGMQILNTVDELNEISSIQDNDNHIVKQEVKIDEIREMIWELNYLVSNKEQLDIKDALSIELPSVLADKSKLKRIFYHLISNGIKYTKEGTVTVSGEAMDGRLYISIEDTGIGIDKSRWNTVFNSFYLKKLFNEDNSSGLGLGLSITSNLIKLHGGEIWVVSKPLQGSKFTFFLPLYEENSIQEEKEQDSIKDIAKPSLLNTQEVSQNVNNSMTAINGKSANDPLVNYTIMVVSNNVDEHKFFTRLLKNMGHYVVFTASDKNNFELLETNKVDIVILKSEINNSVSLKICKNIRNNYSLAELPILVLSDGNVNEAHIYLAAGANDYLLKPYETDELKDRINMLIMVRKSAMDALNYELNSLQAQIMPHFLYNTLNTIIGLSYKDEKKTFEALQNLSTYFRAKLNFKGYQSFVTLESEVELMKAYLSIEQIRYGQHLEILYDIDESIVLMLPSLTLQPLVENAVAHSINVVDKVIINISIYRKEQEVYINVKDNGPGISKEKQEELLSGRNQRIGFTNVMKRVRLMNGSRLIIDSLENMGTSITIILAEGHNECSDNR